MIPGIWERLIAGEAAAEIAREFHVSAPTISLIKAGKTWSHITMSLPGWPLLPLDRDEKDPIFIPAEFANSPIEIWRPVFGYPAYRISTWGRVQSCWKRAGTRRTSLSDEWRDKATSINNCGRVVFWASNGSGRIGSLSVPCQMLIAFSGPRPHGMQACHNDGDCLNNHASNLRFDTAKSNCLDRFRHSR